jgi:hypothetical protein
MQMKMWQKTLIFSQQKHLAKNLSNQRGRSAYTHCKKASRYLLTHMLCCSIITRYLFTHMLCCSMITRYLLTHMLVV